jgi:hypothetical protein
MNRTKVLGVVLTLWAVSAWSTQAQPVIATVCDYAPPESRTTDLSLQGSFSWYDGPYADDRNQSLSADLLADFSSFYASESSGSQMDARTELKGSNSGWSATAKGSGSLRAFLQNDVFGIAAVDLDADASTGIEVDLTGGIGSGRFRDVTPMARAIRIQNSLLDIGQLLAPLPSDILTQLSQALGEVGPTKNEKLTTISDLLTATQLVPGGELNIHGLLSIEQVLDAGDATRLCGSDVQARIGASTILWPKFTVSATGILLARYAAVPDPVSQLESNVEAKFRIADPEQMDVTADASYARQLPDGWTARAEYRFEFDRMWSDPTSVVLSHDLSASLTTQLFGWAGVSVVGDLRYQTGDEELTVSLTVHVEANLF